MKRIIFGSILFLVITGFLILNVIEHNSSFAGYLGFSALWYGLDIWMVIAGVRSLNKKDKNTDNNDKIDKGQ
jgi:hypothetical protein